jgi:hypothetical protein
VHIDRHPLALGEQVGNADWRDGDFLFHGSYFTKCPIESAAQRLHAVPAGVPDCEASPSVASGRVFACPGQRGPEWGCVGLHVLQQGFPTAHKKFVLRRECQNRCWELYSFAVRLLRL